MSANVVPTFLQTNVASATFVQTNVVSTTYVYMSLVSATFVQTSLVSTTFVQSNVVSATFVQPNVLHVPNGPTRRSCAHAFAVQTPPMPPGRDPTPRGKPRGAGGERRGRDPRPENQGQAGPRNRGVREGACTTRPKQTCCRFRAGGLSPKVA